MLSGKSNRIRMENLKNCFSRSIGSRLPFHQPPLSISAPVKSGKTTVVTTHKTYSIMSLQNSQDCLYRSTTVHSKYDLLVWFEICELDSTGKYTSSIVDHAAPFEKAGPTDGVFLLHQVRRTGALQLDPPTYSRSANNSQNTS